MEVNDDAVRALAENWAKIKRDDEEKEYVLPGYKGELVQIPFSELESDAGKIGVLLRLLRKDVDNGVILAFAEMTGL